MLILWDGEEEEERSVNLMGWGRGREVCVNPMEGEADDEFAVPLLG